MGTLDYVAPEQIRGDEVDGRADVYALGCLLFEASPGRCRSPAPSDVAVVYAHLEEEPPRASERRPGLPPARRRRSSPARWRRTRTTRQTSCARARRRGAEALGLVGPSRAAAARSRSSRCSPPSSPPLSRGRRRRSRRVATPPRRRHGRVAGAHRPARPISVTATYPVSAHPRTRSPPARTASGSATSGTARSGASTRRAATCSGSPRPASRATSRRSAATSTSPATGAPIFNGTVTRYDAVTGAREAGIDSDSPARSPQETASCGPPAARSSSGSSPARAALRMLGRGLVPFQQPESAETNRVRDARHGGRRELRSGSSATRSTGASSASIRGAARSAERSCSPSRPARSRRARAASG